MDEYIPREAVLNLQHRLYHSPLSTVIELSPTYIISPDAVQRIPAADVRPVVHGQWIENIQEYGSHYGHKCSKCRYWTDTAPYHPSVFYNYCPNCGAKMDGETNE